MLPRVRRATAGRRSTVSTGPDRRAMPPVPTTERPSGRPRRGEEMTQEWIERVVVADRVERSHRADQPLRDGDGRWYRAGWDETERSRCGQGGARAARRWRRAGEERRTVPERAAAHLGMGQDATGGDLAPAPVATARQRVAVRSKCMGATGTADRGPLGRPVGRRAGVHALLAPPAIRTLAARGRAVETGATGAVDDVDHPVAARAVPVIHHGADGHGGMDVAAGGQRWQVVVGRPSPHVLTIRRGCDTRPGPLGAATPPERSRSLVLGGSRDPTVCRVVVGESSRGERGVMTPVGESSRGERGVMTPVGESSRGDRGVMTPVGESSRGDRGVMDSRRRIVTRRSKGDGLPSTNRHRAPPTAPRPPGHPNRLS